MKTFMVFEGSDINDNSVVSNFRKKERALKYAKKSSYKYVLVNLYDGSNGDEMANYEDTIYERRSK